MQRGPSRRCKAQGRAHGAEGAARGVCRFARVALGSVSIDLARLCFWLGLGLGLGQRTELRFHRIDKVVPVHLRLGHRADGRGGGEGELEDGGRVRAAQRAEGGQPIEKVDEDALSDDMRRRRPQAERQVAGVEVAHGRAEGRRSGHRVRRAVLNAAALAHERDAELLRPRAELEDARAVGHQMHEHLVALDVVRILAPAEVLKPLDRLSESQVMASQWQINGKHRQASTINGNPP